MSAPTDNCAPRRSPLLLTCLPLQISEYSGCCFRTGSSVQQRGVRPPKPSPLVLAEYSFPSLNFVYSASGSLKSKGTDDLKIATTLEEMEMRVKIIPFDRQNREVADAAALSVLGIYPDETTATKKESGFQVAPDLGALLGVIPGIGTALSGIVSALGVTVPNLFRPGFPTTDKAYMANGREFGRYTRSEEERQKEGLRYGTAVLQVRRTGVRWLGILTRHLN
jgi:hypothetical protein